MCRHTTDSLCVISHISLDQLEIERLTLSKTIYEGVGRSVERNIGD